MKTYCGFRHVSVFLHLNHPDLSGVIAASVCFPITILELPCLFITTFIVIIIRSIRPSLRRSRMRAAIISLFEF